MRQNRESFNMHRPDVLRASNDEAEAVLEVPFVLSGILTDGRKNALH